MVTHARLPYLRQKVRKMGYNGFGPKTALPKMSSFKDEDWMGMFSYMFAMYDTSMQINGKSDFVTAQKQALKYVFCALDGFCTEQRNFELPIPVCDLHVSQELAYIGLGTPRSWDRFFKTKRQIVAMLEVLGCISEYSSITWSWHVQMLSCLWHFLECQRRLGPCGEQAWRRCV
jgi:hypothetical protein